MRRNILLLILFFLLFISTNAISCKDEKLKSGEKIEYYRIKLNLNQIKEIGRSRFISLTDEQARYLKNKIRRFHVGGPEYFAPEGWFYSNWVKPDEVIIRKHLIDGFESLIDNSKFEANSKSKNITINMDLDGNFYYKNEMINVEQIEHIIDNLLVRSSSNQLGIHISLAPIENIETKNNALKKVNSLRMYSKEKKIHFMDNL